eukprot:GFYU01000216.1.p1 GENE.GFYU01000216.1~~GFYU01000216.1.p1  ORF type:complete len:365 (-),score=66.47 GFYU01000216.1:375-1469(-)
MKVAKIKSFGKVRDVISVEETDEFPIPTVQKGSKQLLVQIAACSLSPSDTRMHTGDADLMKTPKSWPFVPGGDIAGIVKAIDEADPQPRFKVGDWIIGTWDMFGAGGLAEYSLVDSKFAFRKPEEITAVEAAALANSSGHALRTVRYCAKIKKGDRVLILGCSGGIGTALVQLCRMAGASYIAGTGSDEGFMQNLGLDKVINYTKESQNWWQTAEWKESGNRLDVIIDCAEGNIGWKRACSSGVLKSRFKGGRFVGVMPQEWVIIMHTTWQAMKWGGKMFGRKYLNVFTPWRPHYKLKLSIPQMELLEEVAAMAGDGRLKVYVDDESPHPFTTEGVQRAYTKLEDRKGHGKIVVEVNPSLDNST